LKKRPPLVNADKIQSIVDAVETYGLEQSGEWYKLDELSTHTRIDATEVDPDGVVLHDNQFEGLMTVYVVLEYGGGKEKDGLTTSDSFNGKFSGHFEDDKPIIDRVEIDTSSFYE
jgi:hypothetical protein